MVAAGQPAFAEEPLPEPAPADIPPEEPRVDAEPILAPLRGTGWRYAMAVTLLALGTGWGAFAYAYQLRQGLAVTGLGRPGYWGVYMVAFAFFIGTSLAATLVSAVLRLAHAESLRPMTRLAEAIAPLALVFGGALVVMDLGRPDRVFFILLHGRAQSPVFWDAVSLSAYLFGSLLYLYLALLPDLAILRGLKVGRTGLYRLLALGYTGTPRRAIAAMSALMIPIACSVLTAFAFATTPGRQSMIVSYSAAAALAAGVAVLLLAIAAVGWAMRLGNILTVAAFKSLGLVLLAAMLPLSSFNAAILHFVENKAPFAWATVSLIICLTLAFRRTVAGCVLASLLIVVEMWSVRSLLVSPIAYHPTWVEISICGGCLAGFALLLLLFVRLFPIVSLWENFGSGARKTCAGLDAPAEPVAKQSGPREKE